VTCNFIVNYCNNLGKIACSSSVTFTITDNNLFYSGAQGEYAGLRAIMAYLHAIEETQRKVVISLIM
jgi:glycine cleavage system protein P-like pyridoxal-binding family